MVKTQRLFDHILVPVDGSQPSVAAGRLAVQLAAKHRARITFVYVVDSAVVKELTSVMGKTKQQMQSELERTGRRCLDYMERLAADTGLSNKKVICCGTPCNEIEILIGSVTERVIEYAPCPVLVVK
jgi:nucleotide-binding universal stress UspA family protein